MKREPGSFVKGSKSKRVAIVGGCGHVGMPLGIVIANCPGFDVTLVDVNSKAVDSVNRGELHFVERGGKELLQKVIGRSLRATTDVTAVGDADYVIFITGTPIDEYLNPRINDLTRVMDQYVPYLRAKQTVILRSTVFPGSTELVWKQLQKKVPGILLAFCPERVAQGVAIHEISSIPQIISAFNQRSEKSAVNLFTHFVSETILLTPREAELTKLMANAWRYLQFAIANQFYMMSENSGVDFHRVYAALTYNYPRAKDFARPGFTAGPCLFKDTMQLSAYSDNQFLLGHAAMLVNEGLPNAVIHQLAGVVGDLEGKKVGLLGMAFKPNIDDVRDSLAYKIKKLLQAKMAIVLETDRFQASHDKLGSIIEDADCFILGVPHQDYLSLDLKSKPYVDPWGVWGIKPDLFKSPLASASKKRRGVKTKTKAASI
jgi:UDP-N-acetyl-D-mannosaminuronic acid dehydrogenase